MAPTASDHAYREIRRMLTRGQLALGQRVSRNRLARQMRCSTGPVVEAMRRLESEGLLVKQPRKMARVRKLSPEDLEGLYLLREQLEAVTARLCAKRITDQEARELRDLSRAYEAIWEEGYLFEKERDMDIAIHRLIAKCSHSSLLSSELDRLTLLRQTVGRGMNSRGGHHFECPDDPHVHRPLIQALVDHDADSAEYLMKKHIQNGYREAMVEVERGQQNGMTQS